MIMIMRSNYIKLYSTNTQSVIHRFMGNFFMAQVAADTIYIIKNKVRFNRCPQYTKSIRLDPGNSISYFFRTVSGISNVPPRCCETNLVTICCETNLVTICRCHYKGSTFSSVICSWFELHAGR